MGVWQAWLIIGIPSLAVALLCFVRRSPAATLCGYAALLVGFAGMVVVDPASGAFLGGLVALLYATGLGGPGQRQTGSSEVGSGAAEGQGRGHASAG